jgi:two-component system, OmpR family, manganese sensing sensor histidine kinase
MMSKDSQLATQSIINDLKCSRLRCRLLVSYLLVMLGIFGISGLVVYGLFVKTLHREMDERLEILASGAAHQLTDVQKQSLKPTQVVPKVEDLPKISIDTDGDLDISWQNMRLPAQGIEWFNPDCQLLISSGRSFPFVPLQPNAPKLQNSQLHSLTQTVYQNINGKKTLQGYVRVSESLQEIKAELGELQWILGAGGIVGTILTGLGGILLTQRSLQPIQENLQQLQQFTADASHELRSPLTAIKISVDLLRSDSADLPSADQHRIEVISKGIEQIRYLVEDLLLLTKLDIHLIAHEWRLIAVDEVLEDLLDLLESQAQAKQITLKSKLVYDTKVHGDNTQLPRLFRNLLDNALRYTPDGGTVTVTMYRAKGAINISIVDTGMGIDRVHLPRVFDRFWRAGLQQTGEQHGLGLGLAIAQSIARSHNGEISVDSQLNRGSCFEVKLPLA